MDLCACWAVYLSMLLLLLIFLTDSVLPFFAFIQCIAPTFDHLSYSHKIVCCGGRTSRHRRRWLDSGFVWFDIPLIIDVLSSTKTCICLSICVWVCASVCLSTYVVFRRTVFRVYVVRKVYTVQPVVVVWQSYRFSTIPSLQSLLIHRRLGRLKKPHCHIASIEYLRNVCLAPISDSSILWHVLY